MMVLISKAKEFRFSLIFYRSENKITLIKFGPRPIQASLGSNPPGSFDQNRCQSFDIEKNIPEAKKKINIGA